MQNILIFSSQKGKIYVLMLTRHMTKSKNYISLLQVLQEMLPKQTQGQKPKYKISTPEVPHQSDWSLNKWNPPHLLHG